jgi:hypothetical protein
MGRLACGRKGSAKNGREATGSNRRPMCIRTFVFAAVVLHGSGPPLAPNAQRLDQRQRKVKSDGGPV